MNNKNGNTISISIHGSCVTRDAFEMKPDQFKVDVYISRNSIFSVTEHPLKLQRDDYSASPAYLGRMIFYDFNKMVFNVLNDKLSDYFLIDLIDERFPLLCFEKWPTCKITYSSNLRKSDVLENHELYGKQKYSLINTSDLEMDYIKEKIEKYCSEILKIYRKEQIYINESYLVGHYLDKNNKICSFQKKQVEEYRELNQKLKKLYNLLKFYFHLDNSHIIPMNKPTYACENHKWGLAPFHYEKNYYDNFLKEFMKRIH